MAAAKKCDRCKNYYEKNYFKSDKFFNIFKFYFLCKNLVLNAPFLSVSVF